MENLTDKHLRFIDSYLSNKNMTETCKDLKISRNTAYTYLKDENVKAEITKRRNEVVNETNLFLQDNLKECSKILMEIVKSQNTSPQVKISAINSMFNNWNKITESNEILVKLADIEEKLAEQEQEN